MLALEPVRTVLSSRWRIVAPAAALLLAASLLPAAGQVSALSTGSADPSDVVLLIDFSNSIMNPDADPTLSKEEKRLANQVREDLAETFRRLGAHVRRHVPELANGNATISFVAFASTADDFGPACVGLRLNNSPAAVEQLARCFDNIASEYDAGAKSPIVKRVGTDTNYLAAMTRAEALLPDASLRPAVILFTDGKHDVTGGRPSASEAIYETQRLFDDRARFALLPVGLRTKDEEYTKGLIALKVVREMASCEGEAEFSWPQVRFFGAAKAGDSVADALSRVTCSFPPTAPEPTPEPTPAPPAVPGSLLIEGGDRSLRLAWARSESFGSELLRYEIECREAGTSTWKAYPDVDPALTGSTVVGLESMTSYECQVRAVSVAGESEWVLGAAAAEGRPSAPVSIAVEPRDAGGRATVVPGPDGGEPITGYRVICEEDGGSAPAREVATTPDGDGILLAGLVYETSHQCSAVAVNRHGESEPSPPSNRFVPCGSILQCNPWLVWLIGLLLGLLLLVLIWWLVRAFRDRLRPFITAELDGLPPENVGRGPTVHIELLRNSRGDVTQLAPSGPGAELTVTYRGGDRFAVATLLGEEVLIDSGQPGQIVDSRGALHELTLRGYRTQPIDDAAYDAFATNPSDPWVNEEPSR